MYTHSAYCNFVPNEKKHKERNLIKLMNGKAQYVMMTKNHEGSLKLNLYMYIVNTFKIEYRILSN